MITRLGEALPGPACPFPWKRPWEISVRNRTCGHSSRTAFGEPSGVENAGAPEVCAAGRMPEGCSPFTGITRAFMPETSPRERGRLTHVSLFWKLDSMASACSVKTSGGLRPAQRRRVARTGVALTLFLARNPRATDMAGLEAGRMSALARKTTRTPAASHRPGDR